MTPARRNLWLGIAVVAVVQTVVLASMIWDRDQLLANGREIVLDVVPVDPRSLFQGDYVVLNYDISRVEVPAGSKPVRRGDVVYVTLQKAADDKWKVVQTGAAPPASTSADQIVLKGRVQYTSEAMQNAPAQTTVRYGIENYFVPEGTGRDLEKLVGDKKLAALIAVDGDGNAGIKGLVVEGKRVYEEPLF
jgi:uncharacterized membrane-anchored protein